jgi:hypothetical protein
MKMSTAKSLHYRNAEIKQPPPPLPPLPLLLEPASDTSISKAAMADPASNLSVTLISMSLYTPASDVAGVPLSSPVAASKLAQEGWFATG